MQTQAQHTLTLGQRNQLTVTGVEELVRFDDSVIEMNTVLGSLLVSGEQLNVNSLNLEEKTLLVTGKIQALEYLDAAQRPVSGFRRFFGLG